MTRLSFGRRSVSRRAHESRKRESVWEAAGVSITTTTSRGCGCVPKPPLPEACCSDAVAVADEEFAGAELEGTEEELVVELAEEEVDADVHSSPPQSCRNADSHAARRRSSSGSNSTKSLA